MVVGNSIISVRLYNLNLINFQVAYVDEFIIFSGVCARLLRRNVFYIGTLSDLFPIFLMAFPFYSSKSCTFPRIHVIGITPNCVIFQTLWKDRFYIHRIQILYRSKSRENGQNSWTSPEKRVLLLCIFCNFMVPSYREAVRLLINLIFTNKKHFSFKYA